MAYLDPRCLARLSFPDLEIQNHFNFITLEIFRATREDRRQILNRRNE
jgi:hypothetical protein